MQPLANRHILLTITICLCLLFVAYTPANAQTEATDQTIPEIPVLLYHHIDWDTKNNSDIVSPNKLWQDFLLIKQHGYSPVSFQDVINSVEKEKPLPSKPIIISFDDGYQSNYNILYPMLQIFNYKANINLIIDSIDKAPHNNGFVYLDWEKVKEMHYSGLVEFGVHTFRMHGPQGVSQHVNETAVEYEKRFSADLHKATQRFNEKLGFKPYIYCYPYGNGNDLTEELLHKKGYKVTLYTDGGQDQGLTQMRRITVTEQTSLADILALPVEQFNPLPVEQSDPVTTEATEVTETSETTE